MTDKKYNKRSPIPPNEKERLDALYRYAILDTETDKDFDGIVELASQVFDSPMALINIIDSERQWSKAWKGVSQQESTRDLSFCAYAITGDDVMVINDTLKDDRFADHPQVVGGARIRFYAGMPLVVKTGHKLGALCVMDSRPRTISDLQLNDLRILAKQVANLLDLRLVNRQLTNAIKNKTLELSDIFNRIGDAFISLDKNWRYIYANKQVGELVRRDPASLIGKNVWEEFPDAVNSATYHAFHRAMKEQVYVCHVDYFAPLNLWQENHIYPSPDGLSVFIRDISEQKRAEMKLIENIEALERAEEQAKMGSWYFELSTNTRFLSKQLLVMFGFSPTSNPSTSELLEKVHPEDRNAVLMAVEKMRLEIDPGEVILRTNPLVLPLRYILGHIRPVKGEKRITRFEGTMIDITELQKTNHELDQFVYSVSHDLRAPLATILGLLNVAEMERPDPNADPHLKYIREAANRLDYFIREILDYSMNARAATRIEEVKFEAILDEMKDSVRQTLRPERIVVDADIDQETSFYSDPTRIQIILNNLFSNSTKYQDHQKQVCQVNVRIEVTSARARIVYSDNGIGIDQSHLPKMFSMFYRASENSKGAGLGLYIAREAVHKIGGSIGIDSQLGQGTTFDITIPNFRQLNNS